MTKENDNQNFTSNNFKIEPTISPVIAAVISLIIVFILYQFGGGLLHLLIFGLDLKDANMNALRLFTAAGQLLFILVPTIIFAKVVYFDVTPILRIKKPNWKEILIFILGLGIIIPLIQNFIIVQNYLIQQLATVSSFFNSLKLLFDTMDGFLAGAYGDILTTSSIFEMILVILVVAVVPGVCEEIFFRGFVQKSFEFSIKPLWAIIISSLVFSLYHFNPYGFLALIILASYFGFAAYLSNSIVIPIVLHFIHNLISIIVYFFEGSEELLNTAIVTHEEFQFNTISLVLLTIIFFIFLFLVKKYYNRLSNINEEAL